jgi:hypothetical membrane protein
VAALAVPVLMWAAFLAVVLLRPDFDPLTQIGSSLGEQGSPYALLFNVAHFVIPGILLLLVAGGLYRAVRATGSGQAAAGLVALAGLSLVLSGIVTLDPTSPTRSALHENLSVPFFLGLPAAALLLGRALKQEERAPRQRRLSTGIGLLLVVLVAVFLSFMDSGALPAGLFQRVYLTAVDAWLVVLGLWLLHLSRVPVVVGE